MRCPPLTLQPRQASNSHTSYLCLQSTTPPCSQNVKSLTHPIHQNSHNYTFNKQYNSQLIANTERLRRIIFKKETSRAHTSGNIKPWKVRPAIVRPLLCPHHPRGGGTSRLWDVTSRGLLRPPTFLLAPSKVIS